MTNEMKFVSDVMVMETAASEYVLLRRSGIDNLESVCLQDAIKTNASSIPTPECIKRRRKYSEQEEKVKVISDHEFLASFLT